MSQGLSLGHRPRGQCDRDIVPFAVTSGRSTGGQGEGSPLGFYERYGFEQTSDLVFNNEILLQYKLR
jgi:hypothetical protein